MPLPLQQINLRQILADRMSEKTRRRIPTGLIAMLERLVRQEELNALLRDAYPNEGSAFSREILRLLDIKVRVEGEHNIPPQGRFVFASNHPLGGLDGITLIGILGQRYGDDNIRFLVNDMLMNVHPLQNVFLPINKYGAQGREAAKVIADTYQGDKQIIIFPAGLVSRRQQGQIRDLEWQKAFIVKAIQSHRDIIPVHFQALNSPRFYNTALWRKRLGLKVNIEQALLPGELCKSRGKEFVVRFGKPVSWQRLADSREKPKHLAQALKKIVYSLPDKSE